MKSSRHASGSHTSWVEVTRYLKKAQYSGVRLELSGVVGELGDKRDKAPAALRRVALVAHARRWHVALHWVTQEPRNEARYEPGLVYEARRQYEARIVKAGHARLVYEPRIAATSAQHLRGSYTSLAPGLGRLGAQLTTL